ncbi:MAG: nitrite reductase (NAD(P)H) small subunit, partial [Psychrobacter sp.]
CQGWGREFESLIPLQILRKPHLTVRLFFVHFFGLIGGTTVSDDKQTGKEILYVASPIYKQRFNLATGQCLDDENVKLTTHDVELDGTNVIVTYT